jgi:ribonuclease-3
MAAGSDEVDALEARIGYAFRDRRLLLQALTHTSAVSDPAESYQRLEFLGDRVLALAIATLAYQTFPEAEEGELARRLNALVRSESCAEVGRRIGLGPALRLGAGEAQTGGRSRSAILGDVTEALIAAIYLDGGYAPAADFIASHWREALLSANSPLRDAKTTLQEWAQGRGLAAPGYRQIGRTGPDHDPEFTIAVEIPGCERSVGLGRSKREAEQNAATAMLVREGLWPAERLETASSRG